MGARGRRDRSSGAEADDDVSAGAGVKERRSEAALEWAAGSPWAASSPVGAVREAVRGSQRFGFLRR